LAKHLKDDRKVIREYLKGSKSNYYRGKWKFTYKKTYKTIIENFYNKAWPGKVEILYFLFTVCWNPLRALKTSSTVFLFIKKQYDTVTL
jgi:hypothetical protein